MCDAKSVLQKWGLAASFLSLLLASSMPLSRLLAKDQKMTAEEIVAKHLEALAKPDALAQLRSRLINGTAQATIQVGGAGFLDGKTSILSKGPEIRIGMIFPAQDYPGEHFAYNGSKISVGFITPGVRSTVSAFIYQNEALLKEGLLGGALTSAWPLLVLPVRQPRLSAGGLQKIDNKSFQTLKYRPRKGASDVDVTLFFDAETFRHVRTNYKLEVGPQMIGDINASARQQESRYELSEEFSEFKKEGDWMLPHTYRLQYTILTQGRTVVSSWTLSLNEFAVNADVPESYFTVQ